MNESAKTLQHGKVMLLLADELSELPAETGESVLITGAHAGLVSARAVLRRPPRLAIFNDAGIGKDRAGVAGLEMLEAFNIAAAAVDVATARIGDAGDTLDNGVISVRNGHAAKLGVEVGAKVSELLDRLDLKRG